MRVAWLVLAALAPLGGAASAGQPVPVSLVECGEIFGALADSAEGRGSRSPEDVAEMRAAGERFRTTALREGLPAATTLEGLRAEFAAKWSARFADVLLLGENMEWVEYCGALGRDRGVLPR